MFSAKDLFFTPPASGYTIAKSLRFRSSASAYLSRTPATTTNQQKLTYSFWVKRGALSSNQDFLTVGTAATDFFFLGLSGSDNLTLQCYNSSVQTARFTTTQVFRDPSAWYNIIVAIDTTSATTTLNGSSTDRLRLYINGVQISTFSTTAVPPQNQNLYVNNTQIHYIGRASLSAAEYLDGYLTEVNFIDGQALDASYFGQTDTATGVWMPKAYTGTYGTNGFYLNFSDASAATAAAIGKDSSGNGNNWTPNNISVTAGVTYDSMVDTPTNYDNGGNGAGNYAVLNPLEATTSSTLSNANLTHTLSGATGSSHASSIVMTSGKWYWEVSESGVTNQSALLGILRANLVPSAVSYTSNPGGVYYNSGSGSKFVDGTSSAYGSAWASTGTTYVIGVALDVDGGTVTFYLNNVSQGAITLPSNTLGWKSHGLWASAGGTGTFNYNFGQRPFTYTPPTGFKALCTQNLPTPTIGATSSTLANKYFDATTYTGTGSTLAVTNTGSFQPDFVWIKQRGGATSHVLQDVLRGAGKTLFSNATNAESGNSGDLIASFNSNGFTVNDVYLGGSGGGGTDGSSGSYVGWQWKANGSGSSNTSGSITSTVSANVTAGFSVVTWTFSASNSTVGHGLGVAPKMIICKDRASGAANWVVWHSAINAASGQYLVLNTTAGTSTLSTIWGGVAPTSTTFGQGAGIGSGGNSIVAYCFAEVAGYSKFGSYTGNANSDGPFVYCGFRPRYIMLKCSGAVENWQIYDTARDTYNVTGLQLLPNSSAAEASAVVLDILSNGFKLRNSTAGGNQAQAYIYAAFAESPFNYARAR